MAKLDVRRDYYADLGLSPSADAEDVKKQFRKLALKYHPDRNPGRETEFNAKFQAIQQAHEILSDPHQRLKYDTERLRNGYYGPSKTSSARRESTAGYPTAKPNTKAPFSERPKSFHHGPSTGAQRYASYARAAPKQPWEKTRDETQTRADAYRGFQEMKGNAMPGWSSFDPRGRTGQPGAVPRPAGTANGPSARPKSAYEYVHTSAKPTAGESAHTQSAKKKQGFAPRAAGGDEPMAANTASYRNASRFDRFAPAPSPTSRKPAAGFPNGAEHMNNPEYERSSSKYATTGGERTFFSSSMLGRSASTRTSTKSPNPRPRTNPPSPTPQENGRHRSASPYLKADRGRNYDSTSSSDLSEEEVSYKPKAVPKSRLRQQQKFANFHRTNGWNAGAAHDSDSASSARNNSDTPVFSRTADFAFGSNFPPNGAFKSSSHDDLRKSSRTEPFGYAQESRISNDRGRTSTRDSPPRPNTKGEPSRSDSASHQVPFAPESFLNNDWGAAFKFRDLSDALPGSDTSQRQPNSNSQRTRSPRKQTRGTRIRPTPQQASVATEAEEAEATVDGSYGEVPEPDGEAMDLDDELPARPTGAAPAPERPGTKQEKPVPAPSRSRPTSKSGRDAARNLLNLKNLGGVFPFTPTNSGGLDDLKDISSTLPFESRPKAPKTAMRETHPRELSCPNPPKRPEPPHPVPVSAGSKQLAIPRLIMDRYIGEMNTYVREWEAFDGRMVGHFLSRHRSNLTEMAPNWLGAAGDSLRLSDDEAGRESGEETDDNAKASGPRRRGFTSYKNALVQDEKVLKHWEVARERHLECMLRYGEVREWLRSGGKIL
ncbi:DnaJ domain protein [Aspergillus lucknowensis]|uniref:J domain-containing protein n=1 Tax=Aspergillus lucknowensis TaxID=176173 RepID=A0ABR4M5P0_9EURO